MSHCLRARALQAGEPKARLAVLLCTRPPDRKRRRKWRDASASKPAPRKQASSRALATAAKARVTDAANARAAEEEAVVNARIAEAETAIGKTRDAAMTNVGTIAADTAAAIVERLTGKAPTAAEATAAVKGAA